MSVQAANGGEGQDGEICHVYASSGGRERASCESAHQILGIVSWTNGLRLRVHAAWRNIYKFSMALHLTHFVGFFYIVKNCSLVLQPRQQRDGG